MVARWAWSKRSKVNSPFHNLVPFEDDNAYEKLSGGVLDDKRPLEVELSKKLEG